MANWTSPAHVIWPLVMPFCPQNSWPSFGTYICVNSAILAVPSRHSVKIIVFSTFHLHNSRSTGLRVYWFNSSRLLFGKHICVEFVFSIRGPHLVHHSENIWLFGDENEQYFPLNGSVTIHFHIAFRINSQSDLTSFVFGPKWTNSDSFALNSSCN